MKKLFLFASLGFALVHFSYEDPVEINQILVSADNVNDFDETTTTLKPTTPRACVQSYEVNEDGLKIKITSDIIKSYESAVAFCAEDGAQVISIETDVKQQIINKYISKERLSTVWIGLKKTKPGIAGVGEYTWANGMVIKPEKNANGTDANNYFTYWENKESFDYNTEDDKECFKQEINMEDLSVSKWKSALCSNEVGGHFMICECPE